MMPNYTTRSSRPHESVLPRSDAGYKRWRDGPLQGMDNDEPFVPAFLRYAACFGIGIGLAIGAVKTLLWVKSLNLWWLI